MDVLRDIIKIAEHYPAGFLVILLIIAVVWLARKLDAVNKERQQMAASLFRAKSGGYDIGEVTSQVLERINRRENGDEYTRRTLANRRCKPEDKS
jgi:hypothetical protein